MVRWIAIVLLVTVAALGFVAWRQYATPPAASQTDMGGGAPMADAGTMPPAEEQADPGLHWTVPTGWRAGEPRMMRYATYLIEDAECAVFYFGKGQGGSIDENIDRWAGQFEGSPNPKRELRTVNGMRMTRVRIDGTWTQPGADMKSQGSQPGWRLEGAIVEGPAGMVFFKMTGPAATVGRATKALDGLLSSLSAH
jgi:hypothetical protein